MESNKKIISYKKVLVVNANWLGDAVFSMPVFAVLKMNAPDCIISCLGPPRIKPIMECVPEIDEFIEFDEQRRHKSLWAKIKLILELREKKFDTAILLHRSLTRALIVFLAGIRYRAGYNTKGRGIFLTHKITLPQEDLHRADHYLNVIQQIGIGGERTTSQLTVSQENRDYIDVLLQKRGVTPNQYLIVIHTGGNWHLKQWPVSYFKALIDHLTKEKNIQLIFTGAEGDKDRVNKLLQNISSNTVNLTGQLDIKQLIALLKRADLMISADSGPLHLANSVGTAVIGLFGPTRPELTGPIGSGKSVILQHDVQCNQKACYNLKCPDNICMQAISVEEVLNAVQTIRN